MPPLAHQVILRLRDDRVLAPSPAARRLLASIVLRAGREPGLFAFRAADTHLHCALLADAGTATEFGRRAAIALGRALRLPVGFNPARVLPVVDQAHLNNLFSYIQGQGAHHGLEVDPFHDAGNLPDLLGIRLLGSYTIPRVREHLPRVRRAELLRHLGRTALPEVPVTWEALKEAAAAAAGLPGLDGRSDAVVAARTAAIVAARDSLSTARTAELLGISTRAVFRLRGEAADPKLAAAVRRQAALREGMGAE
jgi:hypothetical protein